MKREILKKTLLYRVLAYTLSVIINIQSPMMLVVSILFATISEIAALILYYTYEHTWRRVINRSNIKKGMSVLLIGNGQEDKHAWYNVIEVLEDNKFVIEVV